MAGNKRPSRKQMKTAITPLQRSLNAVNRGRQMAAARNTKVAALQAEVRAQLLATYLPPEAIEETFAPLYNTLDQIETTGEVDALQGQAIFHVPNQGGRFELVKSLKAAAETFAILGAERGQEDGTTALRRLAAKLDVDMPLMLSDVHQARASLDWMREVATTVTVAQFIEIADRVKEAPPVA